MKIPFNKPFIVGKELDYISRAVDGGHLSGDGQYTKKCHQWLEQRLRSPKALLTHSCTAALEMAAILSDIKPGDEVIMPSFTFVSTANAFVLRGGVPVFIDIRRDNLNLDERLIEAAITPKTKAIVAVHYAGVPCEMDSIMATAGNNDLYVIEDAAQALLSTYNGRHLGAIGHFGCLSFHETKNVISGEGGALLINDPAHSERAEIIREKGTNRSKYFRGQVDKYTWVDIGSSYLPSELVGAFLYAQLEQADQIVETRCRLFQRYLTLLRTLEDAGKIRLPYINSVHGCNGHMFYIITGSEGERMALIDNLKKLEIHAVFHYIPLHSSPGGMKYGRTRGSMCVTEELSGRVLRLPLYFEMQDDDVDRVSDAIIAFYS